MMNAAMRSGRFLVHDGLRLPEEVVFEHIRRGARRLRRLGFSEARVRRLIKTNIEVVSRVFAEPKRRRHGNRK